MNIVSDMPAKAATRPTVCGAWGLASTGVETIVEILFGESFSFEISFSVIVQSWLMSRRVRIFWDTGTRERI